MKTEAAKIAEAALTTKRLLNQITTRVEWITELMESYQSLDEATGLRALRDVNQARMEINEFIAKIGQIL